MNTLPLDELFTLINTGALLGWLFLLTWLFLPGRQQHQLRFLGLAMPLLLSMFYTALVLVFFSDSEGGFNSLGGVMQLFTQPGMVTAGWAHFLAFDLAVGWGIAWDAIRQQQYKWLVIPCLLLTFLFGPIGLLVYLTLRLTQHLIRQLKTTGVPL